MAGNNWDWSCLESKTFCPRRRPSAWVPIATRLWKFSKHAEFFPYEKTSYQDIFESDEWDHKFRFLQSILLLPPTTTSSTTYYCLGSPMSNLDPATATAAGLRCSSQYVWAAGFARCCWTLWLDAKWLSRHHTFDPQRLPGAIQEDHVR